MSIEKTKYYLLMKIGVVCFFVALFGFCVVWMGATYELSLLHSSGIILTSAAVFVGILAIALMIPVGIYERSKRSDSTQQDKTIN